MRGDYQYLTANPVFLKLKKELLNDLVFFIPNEQSHEHIENMFFYNKSERNE